MVVKTITVTEAAYHSITRLKEAHESFSDLFLRLGTRQFLIKDLAGMFSKMHTTEEQEALAQRIQEVHSRFKQGAEGRMERVRARFKRAH